MTEPTPKITDVEFLALPPGQRDEWVAINLAGVEKRLGIEVEEPIKAAREARVAKAERVHPDSDVWLVPARHPKGDRVGVQIHLTCPPYTTHIKPAWDLAMVELAWGRVITLVAWPDDGPYSAGVALDFTRDDEYVVFADHPAAALCLAVGVARGAIKRTKGREAQDGG